MWILSWLPDAVFHAIFIGGVLAIIAGYLLTAIPFVDKNAKVIQVAGIVLTVIGVWFEGGIARDQYYREKIDELKVKIAQAEKEAAEANTKLAEALAKNQILIKENTEINRQKLKEQAQKLNQECKVNNNVIGILNNAARNRAGDAK